MIVAVEKSRQLTVAGDHGQFGRRQPRPERHQDDARLSGCEERIEELEAIAGQDADPIAPLEIEAVKPRTGAGGRPVIHLGVCETTAAFRLDNRDPFRRQPGTFAEDVGADHEPASMSVPDGSSSETTSTGSIARAACSASAVLSGHSRCGTWPQP